MINNKVSNVFPKGDGVASSEAVCKAFADAIDLPLGPEGILPASTGVIGWALPVPEMCAAMPAVVDSLSRESIAGVARAIMTTDRYPKVARSDFAQGASVVGVTKGAGMIEPALCATMLTFVLTDAK